MLPEITPRDGAAVPPWLSDLLRSEIPTEGNPMVAHGHRLTMVRGILRATGLVSEAQSQTRDTFGFKWAKRDTFEGGLALNMQRWLIDKYGDIAEAEWLSEHGDTPVLLDAGCGAALSALALFGPLLDRIRYLGVDVSTAVDVARDRFRELGLTAGFLQANLLQLPLPDACLDLVFSEGVLHHTDDTAAALAAVVRPLKVGGRILFYVYAKKGPIREFTDDHIRKHMQTLTPDEGWAAMVPLTQLGETLGRLNVEVDVPEDVDVLGIPAGRVNLQRLFYWHVFKAFYSPDLTLDELNHINFDWYAPRNAHRQTPQQVRSWCYDLHLEIEREKIEPAGITIIARKKA